MFLLDTNVLSEVRKAGDGKADRHVIAWLSTVNAEALYISAIPLMELELGVLRIGRRDPIQGARLRAWMTHRFLPEFLHRNPARTLPVDAAVALRCAPLHVPAPPRRARRPDRGHGSRAWSGRRNPEYCGL